MNDRRRVGNWDFDDDRVERERLRRDFRELTPAQRLLQGMELSKVADRVHRAGRESRRERR